MVFSKKNSIIFNFFRFLKIYIAFFYSAIIYVVAQIQRLFTWFLPQVSWDKTTHNLSEKHVIYGGENDDKIN